MMHFPSAGTRKYHALLVMVAMVPFVFSLTACNSVFPAGTSPGTPIASAQDSPTPISLPIHTFTLDNFLADGVYPNQDGLLLSGSPPGSTHQAPGGGSSGVVLAPALYFYDFATHQIRIVATSTPAPDGTPRGIIQAIAAGHWVAFTVADTGGAHWSVQTVNTQTGEKRLIGSYLQEESAPGASFYGRLASDGVDLVWSAGVQTTGALSFVLKAYHYASQQSRVLLSGPQTPVVGPLAVSNGTLLFIERHATRVSSDGVYLWNLSEPAAQQISRDDSVTGALNDHFAVWDLPQDKTLSAYDRDTHTRHDSWGRRCVRPAIAQDRPYVVCRNFDEGLMVLAQVPSGQETPLGAAGAGQTGAVVNGRAYWVQPSATSLAINTISYVDLPPS